MLIIKNGKIVTMTGRLIDGGDILIDNGIIKDILDTSSYIPTHSDIIIDAEEKFVFPGFIDVHTHCGLDGSIMGDVYKKEVFIAPQASTFSSINPTSNTFSDCVSNGITTVMVAPFDEQIVGGKCCMVKTAPNSGRELNVLSEFCGTKMSLCSMGDDDSVVLQNSVPDFIRSELRSALEYLSPTEKILPNLLSPALDAYKPILLEKKPAFISVSDDEQLKIAENIVKTFSLNGVIVLRNVDTGSAYMSLFSDNDIPFIINPMSIGSSCRRRISDVLSASHTEFAVSTSHPAIGSDILPINAGMLVRDGLDMQCGLESITTMPADICRVDDRIGTLSPGKDADIVIWSDNPLEVLSNVLFTIIDGRVVYSQQ